MATYVEKIHGFLDDSTQFGTETNKFTLRETVRVEAKGVRDNVVQVISDLPAYGSPGTAGFNPYGITFTLNQSPHPHDGRFYLRSASNAKRVKGTCFWDFPLLYSTQDPAQILNNQDQDRKDQKVAKPDSTDDTDKNQIVDPTDRPAVWKGNTKIVTRPSFYTLEGKRIIHTNGLPISKPYSLGVAHRFWSWSFNVPAETFDYADFEEIENKANSSAFTIPQGTSDTLSVAQETMKNIGFSYAEAWETPSGSTQEYHYVRVTANFEVSPDKWTVPPLSLHTKARIAADSDKLIPININEAGVKATEPWPLGPTGLALTPAEVKAGVLTSFGVLQQQSPDGSEFDFEPVQVEDLGAFFTAYSLTLPRIMD